MSLKSIELLSVLSTYQHTPWHCGGGSGWLGWGSSIDVNGGGEMMVGRWWCGGSYMASTCNQLALLQEKKLTLIWYFGRVWAVA